MDDHYRTIASDAVDEIKIKGSRFIGRTFLVRDIDEATDRLKSIRKQEYNANHNCYAYLVGIDKKNRQFKYSDDGEPGGTAGRPIYDYLEGSGLTNLLIVVTRYFGGTKLGTGGLVKAYGETANAVLDKSGVKDNYITERFKIDIEFNLYDRLVKLMTRLKANQIDSEFSDRVKLTVEIRKSMSKQLESEITELSSGKAVFEKAD